MKDNKPLIRIIEKNILFCFFPGSSDMIDWCPKYCFPICMIKVKSHIQRPCHLSKQKLRSKSGNETLHWQNVTFTLLYPNTHSKKMLNSVV